MRSILKIVFFKFLILNSAIAYSGAPVVDSILTYANQFNDTTKINILHNACWNLRSKKPKGALVLCNKALELIENQKHYSKKAATLNYIGAIYLKLGELDTAMFYFENALSFAQKTNNFVEEAYAYNNFGDYYFEKSLYVLALENALKAHAIFSQTTSKIGLAYSLNNLGEIYIKQNLYDKAIDTLKSAIKIRRDLNDDIRYSISLRNLAITYVYKKEYDKGFKIYNELLLQNRKNNYALREGHALDGLSDIFYEKQDYQEALNNRQESFKIYRKIENKSAETNALNKLGLIYTALKQFSLAKESLSKANELAISKNNKTQLLLNYEYQADLAIVTEDYKSAVEFNDLFINLKDSIFSFKKQNRILELETAYQKAKSEKEILIQVQKEESRKRVLAFLLLSILVLILLVAYMFNQHQKNMKIKKELEELNQSKDKFFSILAHDLRTPITDLMGFTKVLDENYDVFDKSRIKEMIGIMRFSTQNVYDLLSRLLEWSRATTGRISYTPVSFPVYKEVENVLKLMKNIANKKQLRLISKIDPNHSVKADPNMVNTIIRNLVSNAIKFTPEKGSIQISSKKKENRIDISVIDDGVGISKKEINNVLRIDVRHTKRGTNNEKGTGVGLALCNELVKTNKGKLWVKSKPGKGAKFYFSLPLSDN